MRGAEGLRKLPFRNEAAALFAGAAVSSLLLQGTTAGATSYWSSKSLAISSSALDACFYGAAQGRAPSNVDGWTLDFNSWAYKYDRSPASGCSPSAAAEDFHTGEVGVKAYLHRASDGLVCSSTETSGPPNGWSGTGYGWGEAYERSGSCVGNTNWEVESWTINLLCNCVAAIEQVDFYAK
jgi:hypothetical protein